MNSNNPLQGKNIVITRPAVQARNLVQGIERNGGKAWSFPTLITRATNRIEERDRVVQNLNRYQWIVFSSENAVKYFWAEAQEEMLKEYKNSVAAVGLRTAETLQRLGVHVDLVPTRFTAVDLFKAFESQELAHKNILIPASNLTRPELADGLRSLGARVDVVEFYQTLPNPEFEGGRLRLLIQNGRVHCVTFFSPSAFDFLIQLMGENITELLREKQVAIAAIGPTTARAITNHGLEVHIQPETSTSEGMIRALIAFFERNHNA